MRYFQPSEFEPWFEDMDLDLLEVLDEFRHKWGQPVIISPANGALGRRLPLNRKSFHNVNLHGSVKAADMFLVGHDNTPESWKVVLQCAEHANGIGFYPDWKYGNLQGGVHLDVGNRQGRWSAYTVNGRQRYYSINYPLSGERP